VCVCVCVCLCLCVFVCERIVKMDKAQAIDEGPFPSPCACACPRLCVCDSFCLLLLLHLSLITSLNFSTRTTPPGTRFHVKHDLDVLGQKVRSGRDQTANAKILVANPFVPVFLHSLVSSNFLLLQTQKRVWKSYVIVQQGCVLLFHEQQDGPVVSGPHFVVCETPVAVESHHKRGTVMRVKVRVCVWV
jgi:hypothetical protein